MDRVKAELLFEKLKGRRVGPWELLEYRNHGKSAAVFRATDGARVAALKIFDDELIERYGDKTQLARIQRELGLIGKNHPNMVAIYDGGFDDLTKSHYIVMEYLDGKNVKECLNEIPAAAIGPLIEQLSSAARFLEEQSLVHRDIKPENIVLLEDYTKLVLLDFGVLRPIGKPGLTDGKEIQNFIGTLQYSSPEFLLREEGDTMEGWRALTFYQIGAVLHDMIMKRELFSEFAVPYSRLVNAVQHEVPLIQSSAVAANLIALARSCLLKDPAKRLKLLDWQSFVVPAASNEEQDSAKTRVTNRAVLRRAESDPKLRQSETTNKQVVSDVIEFLKELVRQIERDNEAFPRLDVVFRPKHQDRIVIRLRKSEAHELAMDLTLSVNIEIIDASSRAIALSLDGHWGKTSTRPQSTMPPFFKGLFDTATIRPLLEDHLYRLVELAQQRPSDTDGIWLQSIEATGV